jgi:hypothetical protein
MVNKRGSEQDIMALFSMPGTIFLLLVTMTLLIGPMIDNYYVLTDTSVSDLRYEVSFMRVINSKDCLAFEDELGHVHPATIDLSKFSDNKIENTDHLYRCASLRHYNFKLTDSNGEILYLFGEGIPEFVDYREVLLVRYVDVDDVKTGLLEVSVWD